MNQLITKQTQQNQNKSWVDSIKAIQAQFWERTNQLIQEKKQDLNASQIIATLNEEITEPVIVISELGAPTDFIAKYLTLPDKESKFFVPQANEGFQYTISAIIGAFLAKPKVRIIAFVEFDSMKASLIDLETISKLKIPAVLINLNYISSNSKSKRGLEKTNSVNSEDNDQDLIISGEFMGIEIYENDGNQFIKNSSLMNEDLKGWWNKLH